MLEPGRFDRKESRKAVLRGSRKKSRLEIYGPLVITVTAVGLVVVALAFGPELIHAYQSGSDMSLICKVTMALRQSC